MPGIEGDEREGTAVKFFLPRLSETHYDRSFVLVALLLKSPMPTAKSTK